MIIAALGTTLLSICGGFIIIDYWYTKGKELIDYQHNIGQDPIKGSHIRRIK